MVIVATALGLWATKPPIWPWDSPAKRPSTQVARILDRVGPYLCGEPNTPDACDKDPINLLFVNVKEGITPEAAALRVAARLKELDEGWQATLLVGNTMYFEIDGRRTAHHAQMKNYLGTPPDAWHIRLVGSPGCAAGSSSECFVIGAAHFDTRLSGCDSLLDTSFNYKESRQRVRNTFKAAGNNVADVRFDNRNIPSQTQCPTIYDQTGGLNQESGAIAVIDFGGPKEVEWPPTDTTPFVLLDGMLIRDDLFGSTYLIRAGEKQGVSDAAFAACGYREEDVVAVTWLEIFTFPIGKDTTECRD